MSAGPWLNDWLRLFVVLGVEISLLAVGVAALMRRGRSPAWARTLWRAGFVGVLLIGLAEIAGAGRFVSVAIAQWRSPAKPEVIAVATGNLEPTLSSLPPMTAAPEPASADAPTVTPISAPRAIWWPGLVWCAGWALLLVRITAARLIFVIGSWRRCRPSALEIRSRVNALATKLGTTQRPRIVTMTGLATPVSFGTFCPSIALPENFLTDNDGARQDAILAHELAHVVGRDGFWNGVADLMVALFWWHPVVLWMRRQLLLASELAADDASAVVENGPQILAECLVTTARRLIAPVGAGWQGMNGGRFQSGLGRRVERLLGQTNGDRSVFVSRWQRWVASVMVGAWLLAVTALASWVGEHWMRDRSAASWQESWRGSIAQLFLARVMAAEAGAKPEAIEWRTWSPEAVDEARAAGRPVLVFFTADWCVTGAVLEKTALDVPVVRQRLHELQAVAFKADATLATNAAIDAELKALNRGGVPLTVVYSPKGDNTRELLSTTPDTEAILAALNRAQGARADATTVKLPTAVVSLPQATKPNSEMLNAEARRDLSESEVQKPASRTVSKKRETLWARLDSIVIDSFGGIKSLNETVRALSAATREHDSEENKGINFLIVSATTNTAKSLTRSDTDLGDILVQIQPPLRKATVRQILNAMVKGAGELIKYDVHDYAVVVEPAPAEPARTAGRLFTRWFRIDPQRGPEALRKRLGDAQATEPGMSSGLALVNTVRKYLKMSDPAEALQDAVDLSSPFPVTSIRRQDPFQEGKQCFYSDTRGMLLVRATLEELDRIEYEIQQLNISLPQVVIETRLAEIPVEAWADLEREWLPPLASTNKISGPRSFGSERGRSASSMVVPARILTAAGASGLINAASQRRGVDVLQPPRVTTLSGRQAQIKTVQIRSVILTHELKESDGNVPENLSPSSLLVQPFENGPVVDVVPYVLNDGMTMDLTVSAAVQEFIGYDLGLRWKEALDALKPAAKDPASLPPIIGPQIDRATRPPANAAQLAAPAVVPVYRLRKMTSVGRLWDGQTLVLAGGKDVAGIVARTNSVLTEVPFVGRLFNNGSVGVASNKLVVLVTASIIDPAGNRVHRDEEIPAGIPSGGAPVPSRR